MLCEKCSRNLATIFLTQIAGDKLTKFSLCEECGGSNAGPAELLRMFQTGPRISFPSWDEGVAKIVANDPRFPEEAYLFIRDGVTLAHQNAGALRQVTAAEILEALRHLGGERFGSQARKQLGAWNITKCEDFGEIVFALIEHGLFGKSPEDRKEEFSGGYDFATAFPEDSILPER